MAMPSWCVHLPAPYGPCKQCSAVYEKTKYAASTGTAGPVKDR